MKFKTTAKWLDQCFHLLLTFQILADREYLIRKHEEVCQKVKLKVFGRQHPKDLLNFL